MLHHELLQTVTSESYWLMAKTEAHSERDIARRLALLGYATYIPDLLDYRSISRHSAKRRPFYALLAPRLVFIAHDAELPLASCRGIKGYVLDDTLQPYRLDSAALETFRVAIAARNAETSQRYASSQASIAASRKRWQPLGADIAGKLKALIKSLTE